MFNYEYIKYIKYWTLIREKEIIALRGIQMVSYSGTEQHLNCRFLKNFIHTHNSQVSWWKSKALHLGYNTNPKPISHGQRIQGEIPLLGCDNKPLRAVRWYCNQDDVNCLSQFIIMQELRCRSLCIWSSDWCTGYGKRVADPCTDW